MTEKIPPTKWSSVLYANIGAGEEFVKQFLELPTILDGTMIVGEKREQARSAIMNVLTEGLMPAFLELRKIRTSGNEAMPVMDRLQLFEDFSRKLWKAFKELTQGATKLIGLDIGFAFEKDTRFEEGLKLFRERNPTSRLNLEGFLRNIRSEWQTDLKTFRNEVLEHSGSDRQEHNKFYDPQFVEYLFNAVSWASTGLIAMALSEQLPRGIFLLEQDPNNPDPLWPNRFRIHIPGLNT